MASIQNCSRYTVSVKHRDDLYREFPYSALKAVKAYAAHLVTQGFKPQYGQREDKLLVRIRNKGFAKVEGRFGSMAEAQAFILQVEAEQCSGFVRTTLKSRNVTFVDVLKRYIAEEGTRRPGKSWETVDRYRFEKLLRAATGTFNARERRELAAQLNIPLAKLPATLQPACPWMQKPFCDVTTDDLEDFIQMRLDEGLQPATVDRELDLLAAVLNVAINVWDYAVPRNPMAHLRRPKYFNERDRRLKAGEEARLLDAARREDAKRAQAAHLELLVTQSLENEVATQMSASARKYRVNQLRRTLSSQAERVCQVTPLLEAFVLFQLRTAARRSESLALTWAHVDLEARSAHFPMTKNGRPRTVPLRADVAQMLASLPKDTERVFPLSVDTVKNAWQRIIADAGIADLNLHDLRHEAISSIAETGAFSLIDLQAISGHRDVRMLLRYSHLCVRTLAARLDAVFAPKNEEEDAVKVVHRGRRRLTPQSGITLREVISDTLRGEHVVGPLLGHEATASNCATTSSAKVIDLASRRKVG